MVSATARCLVPFRNVPLSLNPNARFSCEGGKLNDNVGSGVMLMGDEGKGTKAASSSEDEEDSLCSTTLSGEMLALRPTVALLPRPRMLPTRLLATLDFLAWPLCASLVGVGV